MSLIYRRPLAVLLYLASAALGPAHSATVSPKIFGGDDAVQGDWPWMTLLAVIDPAAPPDGPQVRTFRCGGILINEHYVLTAAHCLFNTNENPPLQAQDIRIAYNQVEAPLRLSGYQTSAAEIIIHPDYDERQHSGLRDDIALLRLRDPAASVAVFPALANQSDISSLEMSTPAERNDITLALGWGRTETGQVASTLQQVSLDYIPVHECNRAWGGVHISDKMVCAAEPDPPEEASLGQDTCFGDSGGPLLVNADSGTPVSIGITSFGTSECGRPDPPGVYTNVAFYRDWIEAVLHRNAGAGEPETSAGGSAPAAEADQGTDRDDARTGASGGFSNCWPLLLAPLFLRKSARRQFRLLKRSDR